MVLGGDCPHSNTHQHLSIHIYIYIYFFPLNLSIHKKATTEEAGSVFVLFLFPQILYVNIDQDNVASRVSNMICMGSPVISRPPMVLTNSRVPGATTGLKSPKKKKRSGRRGGQLDTAPCRRLNKRI